MVLNRLGEPDAMAPTAPSETCDSSPKHVFITLPAERSGNSRSVIQNRLDALFAMAPTAPSETIKQNFKHVCSHSSAQSAFQGISCGDSELSLRALRNNGANGALGAVFGVFSEKKKCGVVGVSRASLAQTISD